MENKDYSSLRLENQICHRLYLASNGLTRLYRPLLKKLNLSYPQYIVMMSLWEKDKVSMSELANHTLMDKGFLTTLVGKLQDDSILKLVSDPNDKRKRIIKLTKKGQKLQDKALEIPKALMCNYELPDESDILKLKKLLDEVIRITCSD